MQNSSCRKTSGAAGGNSFVTNTKIVVPLKYLSNFWRSLEKPLINCKVHLELNWIEDCVLSSAGNSAKFKIADAALYIPIVTLSTKDSVNLTKQLSDGFERSVYWNQYQTNSAKVINNGANIYELLSASCHDAKRLFVLVYDATSNEEPGIKSNNKYFLPRADIKDYNVLIGGRNFSD